MRSRLFVFTLGVAAVAAFATPVPSDAQCSGNAEIWGNDQIVSLSSSGTNMGLDFSWFAHGPVLYAIWNESGTVPDVHSAGDFKYLFSAGILLHELGHNLGLDHGGAVIPAQGPEALFVTSDNGRVYKLDVQTGAPIGSADARRAFCSADAITAAPAVQLYSASNAAFQGAMLAARSKPDDLVFVVTHHGCGDHDGNQVIAYYASDLSERWRFNATGSVSMDYAKDGCEIDSGSNVLYCGTNQSSPAQSTLWAINSLTGSLIWSHNAGSIQNRPQLKSGPNPELYVASSDGTIQRRDPSSGSLIWAYPTGSTIVRNIWPEFRPPNPTRIYCTTSDGLLHGVMNNFPAPVPLWPPITPGSGLEYTTMPAVASGLNTIYVGRSDGYIQQVSIDGAAGPVMPAGTAGTVFDPSFDVSSPGAPDLDRLMVTTTEGGMRRYCIPWGATTAVPAPVSIEESFLSQSAPNPFSSHTQIEYRLPYDARVAIDVYDVEGHRVRALARDQEPAGAHEVSWNGLDDAGRRVASGLYFYRLRATGAEGRSFERTKRVQVVR